MASIKPFYFWMLKIEEKGGYRRLFFAPTIHPCGQLYGLAIWLCIVRQFFPAGFGWIDSCICLQPVVKSPIRISDSWLARVCLLARGQGEWVICLTSFSKLAWIHVHSGRCRGSMSINSRNSMVSRDQRPSFCLSIVQSK